MFLQLLGFFFKSSFECHLIFPTSFADYFHLPSLNSKFNIKIVESIFFKRGI